MKISIAYTEICLPDYFSGDARPWVAIYPSKQGYTSRELRDEIKREFSMGAVGGSDDVASDFIADPEREKRAILFFKKLPAALNRCIKYRGRAHKFADYPTCELDVPLLHIVFNIEEFNFVR